MIKYKKKIRRNSKMLCCLNELYNFIEKERRLPNRKDGRYPYQILYRLRINDMYHKAYPELVKKIENLCNDLDIIIYGDKRLLALYEFLKYNKILPKANKKETNTHYRILFKLRKGEFDKNYPELVGKIKTLCKEIVCKSLNF